MANLIALKSGVHEILPDAWTNNLSKLKQQVLLFDQIGIYKLNNLYTSILEYLDDFKKLAPEYPHKAETIITELQWLQQMGIIFELTIQDAFQNQHMDEFKKRVPIQNIEDAMSLLKKIIDIQTSDLRNTKDEVSKTNLIKEQHFSVIRLLSIIMEITNEITAVTMFPYTEYSREVPNSIKSNVAQIVINKLPLPRNDTPWEQVIDYRNDPENQNNLLGLRQWIRKISKEELSKTEIEDEIEWRINEFQNHLKFHKMKANTETLEIIVKAPLEIIENLVKLKFSKLPEPFFAVKKRQINLMEAELNAPGREMAYIIKTRDTFQSGE